MCYSSTARVFHLNQHMKKGNIDNRGLHAASFGHGQGCYSSNRNCWKRQRYNWNGQDLQYRQNMGWPRYSKTFSNQEKKEKDLAGQDKIDVDERYLEKYSPQTTIAELSGKPWMKEKASNLKELLEQMPESIEFNEGHFTPKLKESWCRQFEAFIDVYQSQRLIEIIREAYGYTLEQALNWDGNQNSKAYEYVLIERVIGTVLLTYSNFTRKSGNEAASHPLRAMAYAAGIGAPLEVILTCGLHDVDEDTLDKRADGLRYRAMEGGKIVEFDTSDEILAHIGGRPVKRFLFSTMANECNLAMAVSEYNRKNGSSVRIELSPAEMQKLRERGAEHEEDVERLMRNSSCTREKALEMLGKTATCIAKHGFVVESRNGGTELYVYEKSSKPIYGRFGKRLAENVKACTRMAEIPDDVKWKGNYLEYLMRVYNASIAAAFTKGIDGHINLLELSPINDAKVMRRIKERAIFKVGAQVERWRSLSFPIAELLYYEILKYSKRSDRDRLRRELRETGMHDIEKFRRGWTLNGERQYSAKLMEGVSPSGSPIIDVYRWKHRGRMKYEIEIPFVQDEETARKLVKKAFGGTVENLARAKSILPTRLTYSILISFDAREGFSLQNLMPKFVRAYDRMLRSGDLLPQLEGFRRSKWAAAAKRRHKIMRKELKKLA